MNYQVKNRLLKGGFTMILKITGIAILTTAEGKRITYSYSKIDENGTIVESNIKQSFVVLDEDIEALNLIKGLEDKVKQHMEVVTA